MFNFERDANRQLRKIMVLFDKIIPTKTLKCKINISSLFPSPLKNNVTLRRTKSDIVFMLFLLSMPQIFLLNDL